LGLGGTVQWVQPFSDCTRGYFLPQKKVFLEGALLGVVEGAVLVVSVHPPSNLKHSFSKYFQNTAKMGQILGFLPLFWGLRADFGVFRAGLGIFGQRFRVWGGLRVFSG
jgi:hypothetical protein